MDYTFSRVAALCGLRLSYYITAALLGISFLLLVPTEFRTPSPLYILLALAVLPSLTKTLFYSSSQKEKRENTTAFPLFCKKYKYDFIRYKSMNISYFLLFVLLSAWIISYNQNTASAYVRYIPVLITCISLITRILGVTGYRLYFHLFPLRAMR